MGTMAHASRACASVTKDTLEECVTKLLLIHVLQSTAESMANVWLARAIALTTTADLLAELHQCNVAAKNTVNTLEHTNLATIACRGIGDANTSNNV